LLAVGGLAWTLIAGPQGLEQIQRYKERALYRMTLDDESAPPAEAAPASAAVPVTDSLPPPPAPPDSMKAPPPTPAR
ncbi:MAG TPA: hypothetical protein VFU59_04475, partial [Candidatus Eisenbacteria bacterium]|nr:hypothetical protein [Candidatus Eisenbacteria bacterium]